MDDEKKRKQEELMKRVLAASASQGEAASITSSERAADKSPAQEKSAVPPRSTERKDSVPRSKPSLESPSSKSSAPRLDSAPSSTPKKSNNKLVVTNNSESLERSSVPRESPSKGAKGSTKSRKTKSSKKPAATDSDNETEILEKEIEKKLRVASAPAEEEEDSDEEVRKIEMKIKAKEKAKKLADLKARLARLEADEADPPKRAPAKSVAAVVPTSTAPPPDAEFAKRFAEHEAKMAQLEREKLAMQRELDEARASSVASYSTSSRQRLDDLERERRSLQRQNDELGSIDSLRSTRSASAQSLSRVQFGIDVCFMMDCTGSMSSYIKNAKERIVEIVTLVKKNEQRAVVKIAFVGYRDHCDGNLRIEKFDFIDADSPAPFQAHLANCRATGGGDGPEDIVGGLQAACSLSWSSSTRLMIHFADAPCHGNKYHGGMGDDYPSGDPNGLEPETFLKKLASQRVDYYFMEINPQYTRTMTQIFSGVYMAAGKPFEINPITANPADFVPKVVKSITSSMARSAAAAGRSGAVF